MLPLLVSIQHHPPIGLEPGSSKSSRTTEADIVQDILNLKRNEICNCLP